VKPNYGIDAPGVVRNMLIIGIVLIVASFAAPRFSIAGIFNFNKTAIITGIVLTVEALLMVLYSKYGKFPHRDRMLNMINWKGNETVLDVGTGAGLLMIGAAKHIPTGKSVGIDIWSGKDLSDNSAQTALSNAAAEGVVDRVEVRNEDICNTTFSDASFDVVLSNLCLHNIVKKADRSKACREIARILKLGGVAIISDFKYTGQYAREFRNAGVQVEKSSTWSLKTFPPLSVIKVMKA
jgi:arsenite methyltransferase